MTGRRVKPVSNRFHACLMNVMKERRESFNSGLEFIVGVVYKSESQDKYTLSVVVLCSSCTPTLSQCLIETFHN